MMDPGCKSEKGFTLIELLVVITIMPLLVAILLPSLRQARSAAFAIQCGSGMRQVHLSFSLYAQDNADEFPRMFQNHYFIPKLNDTRQQYWWYMDPHRRGYLDGGESKQLQRNVGTAQLGRAGTLACPTTEMASTHSHDYEHPDFNVLYTSSYAVNRYLWENTAGEGAGLKIDMVPTHAAAFLMSDNTQRGNPGTGSGRLLANAARDYFEFRHLESVNMLYLDGHVQRLQLADIPSVRTDESWHGGTE